MTGNHLESIGEIMISAGDFAKIDLDVALMRQLGDESLDRVDRHDRVVIALQDQARGGAWGEKGEVVNIRRRGDHDKALDLRPAHQQLHADPGAERVASHPTLRGGRVGGLEPVERGRRIRQLALTLRGRNLLVQCDAEVDRFEEALFGVLAAPEREALRRLLIRIIAADRSARSVRTL